MSNRQDRQGARTPADIERKYLLQLGKTFAEILGIATDARKYAEKTGEDLSAEIARLDVKIQETADGIILSVEDVYATNESVASAIEVMRGDILLDVHETYETQENAQAKYANIQLQVDDNRARIASQAQLIEDNDEKIALMELTVDSQGASIGLIVDDNGVKGSVVVEAINGQSSAKISADKLDIEGKELNIKVKSTNIEGEINADQINADGLEVVKGKIGGWTLGECQIPIGTAFTVTTIPDGAVNIGNIIYKYEIALYSGHHTELVSDNTYYTYETWLTPSGVSIASQYYADGGGNSPTAYTTKTWRQILAGS